MVVTEFYLTHQEPNKDGKQKEAREEAELAAD